MAKYAALTVRKLKDGSYDDWRRAWQAEEWPEGVKAYILRNLNDPNEVIAFGITDREPESFRNDPKFADQERQRQERMAPHVESTGADGFYEVVEEVDV